VVATQLLMGLSLLPLATMAWQDSLGLLFALLLLHAFAASTQDVAIDAWAISVTPAQERGSVNGWMQSGMLLGRWLFGAGFLIVAHQIDDTVAVLAMVAVIWTTTLVVLLSSDRDEYLASGALRNATRRRLAEFMTTLRLALRRRETWLGLALALIAFAGFKGVGDIAGPFLVDQGLAPGQVGHFFTGALVAMIAGALGGGWAADRFGNTRAIRGFVVFAVLVILMTSIAAWTAEEGHPVVIAGMLGVFLCAGLLTASAYALFMQLTDPKLGATQFSAYMGAINGCEAWAGFAAGQLAERLDYPVAFVTVAMLSLLALPLLGWIGKARPLARPGPGQ
jgi:MFS family permease